LTNVSTLATRHSSDIYHKFLTFLKTKATNAPMKVIVYVA